MLFSLSKDYNTQVLGGDQKPNFSPKDAAMQVGIERYVAGRRQQCRRVPRVVAGADELHGQGQG